MNKIKDIVLNFLILVPSMSLLLLLSCNKFTKNIHKLEKENKKLERELLNRTSQLIDSRNRECQYYIEHTNDGFIIDGVLYESKESK